MILLYSYGRFVCAGFEVIIQAQFFSDLCGSHLSRCSLSQDWPGTSFWKESVPHALRLHVFSAKPVYDRVNDLLSVGQSMLLLGQHPWGSCGSTLLYDSETKRRSVFNVHRVILMSNNFILNVESTGHNE